MSFELLPIFAAGLLTFLTPCVLPLVPIYLAALTGGNIQGLDSKQKGKLLLRASFFSLGFILVFTAMGFGASHIGQFLSDHKTTLQIIGALLVLVFALKFLGILKIPFLDKSIRGDDSTFSKNVSVISAFFMGIIFAAGWSPCVGPILGSILTYTASSTANPLVGAGYLAVYGLGFAIPLLLVAAFAQLGLKFISAISQYLPKIEKGIGIFLLFISGMLLIEGVQATTIFAQSAPTAEITQAVDASKKPIPMMIEFSSKDCSVCKKMQPTVRSITEQCDKNGVSIEKIDVSTPKNRHFIQKYNLVGVPTYVFLDEKGAETSRLVGEQSKDTLKQTLSILRGKPCPGVAYLPNGIDQESTQTQNCNI